MALTQCSECGGKVSTSATACPHCDPVAVEVVSAPPPASQIATRTGTLAVADVCRFEPALNRDQPRPLWVSFPVTFQVR